LIGLLSLALLAWVFWPKWGLLAFFGRVRQDRQRVLLEDALKFMFDCEYKHKLCSLNAVAGHLHISTDKATDLLTRLRTLGLAQMKGDQNFELTDSGRSYALRVIRVHRIWERYLADETGLEETEWHGEADFREHRISPEAADRLAARMGNPVFDPHGDPIPTSKGEIPALRGIPLHQLEEGEQAVVVHMEDEPASIYEQLVALGLYPGMPVYLLDKTDSRITFAANGEECVLTPLFASNITVERRSPEVPLPENWALLSSLKLGEKAEVLGISPNCRGAQRRRLLDLGMVPGTQIQAGIQSASGDPTGYRILGATIALRKDQADLIFIRKKEEHEPIA
jgi:DtxR family Mn-dependent transcriptional regulator